MTLDDMKAAANAMKRDRMRRDELWAAAEPHLRLAEEAHGQHQHCEAMAADRHGLKPTAEEMARNGRLAKHWRLVSIGHQYMAAEWASASGVDTSVLEFPEV